VTQTYLKTVSQHRSFTSREASAARALCSNGQPLHILVQSQDLVYEVSLDILTVGCRDQCSTIVEIG